MMQNYQPYQPYPQPYQQPYQPMMNIPNIPGRVVDDFNNIGANDVAMDGSASVFLKRDLSELQIRKWGADGRIYSTTYRPEELKSDPQEDNFSNLNDRLQAIEEKIDKLIKPTAKKVAADGNT